MPRLLNAHPDDKDILLPRLRLPRLEGAPRPDPGEGDAAKVGEEEVVEMREKVQEKVRRRFNPATPLSCFESEK